MSIKFKNITSEEKQRIADYCRTHPGLSNIEIGKILGHNHHTIERWKKMDVSLDLKIHKWLMTHKKEVSLDDICNHFEISPRTASDALEKLKGDAKSISLISPKRISAEFHIPPSEPSRLDISKFKGRKVMFGVTADNHLCSKYYRDDILHALFDIWEEQGIKDVYQGGNMIDGEAHFNKHDLIVHGMQNQVDYFVENWPQRKGMTTHFVTGDDHEGWYVQKEGVNIGEFMHMVAQKAGRSDLQYLGHMEHDVIIKAPKGEATLRNMHAGGGSAYATSYSVQKIVESYTGGEKPGVMLVGHFHKAEYSYIRNIHVVQAACTEDQTPFMRKRRLMAHLGGWTVSFEVDEFGIIHDFTPKFHNFYDRGFYEENWRYRFKSEGKRGRK